MIQELKKHIAEYEKLVADNAAKDTVIADMKLALVFHVIAAKEKISVQEMREMVRNDGVIFRIADKLKSYELVFTNNYFELGFQNKRQEIVLIESYKQLLENI